MMSSWTLMPLGPGLSSHTACTMYRPLHTMQNLDGWSHENKQSSMFFQVVSGAVINTEK